MGVRGRPDLKGPCGPSLRRDKQSGEEVVSDIQVTPAFQKFVASKLDELLELEDVEVVENCSDANGHRLAGSQLGVKLTKRSRIDVNSEEAEALSVSRMKPSLLSHREPQVTAEDLSDCAVTGDDVIAGKGVKAWSTFPFFPDKVVQGEQRIKRKKKKVKKKKKQELPLVDGT